MHHSQHSLDNYFISDMLPSLQEVTTMDKIAGSPAISSGKATVYRVQKVAYSYLSLHISLFKISITPRKVWQYEYLFEATEMHMMN